MTREDQEKMYRQRQAFGPEGRQSLEAAVARAERAEALLVAAQAERDALRAQVERVRAVCARPWPRDGAAVTLAVLDALEGT